MIATLYILSNSTHENPLRLPHTIAAFVTTLLLFLPTAGSGETPTALVKVQPVEEAEIKEVVRLTGTVTADRASNLSPATSGLVTTLKVDAGSRVASGDLLLELDSELARWQAQNAEAAVRAARVSLDDARRRLKEARALAPQQSIAETLVHELAAEVAQNEAALQQADAEAGYRLAILDRHQLRAPYNGVIAAKLTEVGEWVVPGDAVLELVAIQDLRVDFPVAEKYLGRMKPGARVTFKTGFASATSRTGTVVTVVPVSDPSVRTFLLRIEPDDGETRLSPGMSAHGRIDLDAGRRGLVVPRDAIIRYPDSRVIVWVVDSGEGGLVASERLVETGLAFDDLVEIRSGLEPGTRVVVRGNEALQVGQPVTVIEGAPD